MSKPEHKCEDCGRMFFTRKAKKFHACNPPKTEQRNGVDNKQHERA